VTSGEKSEAVEYGGASHHDEIPDNSGEVDSRALGPTKPLEALDIVRGRDSTPEDYGKEDVRLHAVDLKHYPVAEFMDEERPHNEGSNEGWLPEAEVLGAFPEEEPVEDECDDSHQHADRTVHPEHGHLLWGVGVSSQRALNIIGYFIPIVKRRFSGDIDATGLPCYDYGMVRINLGIILENLESELRKTFRSVVTEDHTNSIFRAFRKEVKKNKTWYTVPDHLIEKD